MSSSPASAAGVERSAMGQDKAADEDEGADAHVKLTLIRPASEAVSADGSCGRVCTPSTVAD